MHLFSYSILSLQVVTNNQHFSCKLQDNDTLRSYEMTAVFQEKIIVNFPMRYFLAKLRNTLKYLEVMYILSLYAPSTYL